jgi:hypothetical protein
MAPPPSPIAAAVGSGVSGLHSVYGNLRRSFIDNHRLILNVCGLIPLFSRVADESPWNTRGWAFQERFLSSKCLFITDLQVYFICNRGQMLEEEKEQDYYIRRDALRQALELLGLVVWAVGWVQMLKFGVFFLHLCQHVSSLVEENTKGRI